MPASTLATYARSRGTSIVTVHTSGPSISNGVVFMMLQDESGVVNVSGTNWGITSSGVFWKAEARQTTCHSDGLEYSHQVARDPEKGCLAP